MADAIDLVTFDGLSPLTTRGDLLIRNATTNTRLAAGTSGQFLKTLGSGAEPAWGAAPFGQLAVLAGDSAGINPASATRYFFAQNVNVDPTTGNSAFQHVIVTACTLRAYSVVITVAGTKDSGANNVTFNVRVNNTTDVGTQTVTFQSAQQTVNVSGLSTALAAGDQLQITFLTPTFSTLPTLVFFAGGIVTDVP